MITIKNIKQLFVRKALLLLSTMLVSTFLMAGEKDTPNRIIVSGQVINCEYGNPVEGHTVTVESVNGIIDRGYFKKLITDSEGYYRDTIFTNYDNGSFKISTLDYHGITKDTTVHYRFINYTAYNFIIANFSIYMPFHTQVLQAKFKYFQKMNDDRFKFTFRDFTNSEDIIKWHWDFGDGDSSAVQNPSHTYLHSGAYKVGFTVTIYKNSKIDSNTITSLIYISDKSYFHMGGHAFGDYFPIDKGLAYLYLIDSNSNYIPVDTVQFDTLGYYFFYQLPVGEYVVKSQPDKKSIFYGEFTPTYYGDKMFWEDAGIINLTNTSWEYDIHLLRGVEMTNGSCSLQGNVIYSNLGSVLGNLPAELVDLYLVSKDNMVYRSHYSDETGFFSFNAIPTGNYLIRPELTGIKTEGAPFELTDEDPSINGIEIVLGYSSPDFIFENPVKESIINNVFPNPAADHINITFNNEDNSDLNIELIDLSGKVVYSSVFNVLNFDSKSIINVSDLKSGLYILKISNKTSFDSQMIVVD